MATVQSEIEIAAAVLTQLTSTVAERCGPFQHDCPPVNLKLYPSAVFAYSFQFPRLV
jgi:hypothetical protein